MWGQGTGKSIFLEDKLGMGALWVARGQQEGTGHLNSKAIVSTLAAD